MKIGPLRALKSGYGPGRNLPRYFSSTHRFLIDPDFSTQKKPSTINKPEKTMLDQELIDAIAQGDLILAVDATRNDYDLQRLSTPLRDTVTQRLAAGRAANSAVAMAAGNGAAARFAAEQALGRLGALLRNGLSALKAIPTEDVPEGEVLDAMTSYGWENGNLGDLESASRVISLAELAVSVTGNLPAAVRYPANVVTRLTTWLGVYQGNVVLGNGGTMQTIIEDKNRKRDALLKALSRVRHHYCAGSDDGEYNVELARIGFQPKRPPGEAQPQPLPAGIGVATFNAGTRELTVPALPEHATTLVAYRKAAGGAEEQAGVSTTTVVGVSDFSPLVAGVVYELSCAGRNSRGVGPRSNVVVFTA
jgi:hypothetical protein